MRFRNTVNAHIEQLLRSFGLTYVGADSALYVAETLKEMDDILWFSRVPSSLTLACDIIHAVAPDLMKDPAQAAFRSLGTVYGDVKQRWLVVYSPEAYQRVLRTVNKQCLKQSTAEFKDFNKLCKSDFACEADACKTLVAFKSRLSMTFIAEAQVNALPRFKGKGRPAQGRKPDFYVYCIEGSLASLPFDLTRRLERKSCFIVATNQPC